MRSVRDHSNQSVSTNDRGKSIAGVILLIAKLTNRGVQRHRPVVAAKVKEELALVVAQRIDVDADARRPTARDLISQQVACDPFLLPTASGLARDETVHLMA